MNVHLEVLFKKHYSIRANITAYPLNLDAKQHKAHSNIVFIVYFVAVQQPQIYS